MSELKVEQVFKKFDSLALTSNDNKTKSKRKNSEKRKEKSRYAARARRSQESEIFNEMGDQLPISEKAISLMDKSSIVRLGINFIKIRHLIDTIKSNSLNDAEDGLAVLLNDYCAIKALNGIIFVLSKEGDMIYLSENVDKYLGLTQIDLMGQSIYDYSHPCDHRDIKDLLALKNCSQNDISNAKYNRIPCSTFIRMKCTLTNKGRNLNLKSAPYKIIHFTGHMLNIDYIDVKSNNGVATQLSQSPRYCLFTIGELIDHPHCIEKPLSESIFVSRHSLDMKYLHVDDRIRKILGYCQKDLTGKSLYNFFHASDLPLLEHFFKTLFTKGQCESGYYRYLAKFGGYAWLLTEATVITDNSPTSEPQCVICINHVISDIENKTEITSEEQVIYQNNVEVIVNEINKIPENQSSTIQAIQPIRPIQAIQASINPSPNPAPKPPITIISSTQSVFAPKTADMESGFLVFTDDDANDMTILADAEDLTHLAPEAGDVSVPLDVPSMFNIDLNDMNFFDDLVSSLNGYNMNNFADEDKSMKMNDENMNFILPNDNQELRVDDFFKAKDESETIGKIDDSYMLKCVVQNIIKNPNILKDINLNDNIAHSPSSDDLFLNSLSPELVSHSPTSSDSSDASDLYSPDKTRSPSMNTPSPVLSQSSNYYCESPTYEAVSKLTINDTEKFSDDIDLRTAYIPDNEDFSLLNEELQLYSHDLIDIDLPTNKQVNFDTTTKPTISDVKLYNNGQNCNYLAMLLQSEMPYKSKKLNNNVNPVSKYDSTRLKNINNYNMLNNNMSSFNSPDNNRLAFNSTANIMDSIPNGVSANMRTNDRLDCNQTNNGFLSPLKCNYVINTQNMMYPNKTKPNIVKEIMLTKSGGTKITNGYKRPHSSEPPDLLYANDCHGLLRDSRLLPKVQTKNQQNKRRKADDAQFKNKGSSVLMNLLVNGEDVTNGYSKYSSMERVPKSYNIANNPGIYQKYSNAKKCTKNAMLFEEKHTR